jgi:hypothetical protein
MVGLGVKAISGGGRRRELSAFEQRPTLQDVAGRDHVGAAQVGSSNMVQVSTLAPK